MRELNILLMLTLGSTMLLSSSQTPAVKTSRIALPSHLTELDARCRGALHETEHRFNSDQSNIDLFNPTPMFPDRQVGG